MRIAIFHNYLDNIGGAEIVTLELAKRLDADVYTTSIDKEKIKKIGYEDVAVYSIGRVFINAPFRQQATLLRFRFFKPKKEYDFYIVSGDWALSSAVKNKPNMWLVYAPPRELWDLYEHSRKLYVPWYARWIFDIWVYTNRYLTKKYITQVQKLFATSKNVQGRIKKFFNIEADIIYPAIDTNKFFYEKNGDFWLSVNRLIPHKRIEMQLEAFAQLPNEKLIIVGSYEKARHFVKYAEYIKKIKPANVEIKSWVTDDELKKLYATCKGVITTSFDEDFGLTPIEAMASGKPVIAPNEGGYKETILHSATGALIDDISADKLQKAVKKISPYVSEYKDRCLERARQFDISNTVEKIQKEIKKIK